MCQFDIQYPASLADQLRYHRGLQCFEVQGTCFLILTPRCSTLHRKVPLTPLLSIQTYLEKGKYEEAGILYGRALTIKETVHGRDHPEVATTLNNQAALLSKQVSVENVSVLLRDRREAGHRRVWELL